MSCLKRGELLWHFLAVDFKFVRVDFGASKELIETRQEGKCEGKVLKRSRFVSHRAKEVTKNYEAGI